jgi:peptide/nickel transport system permease protein
VLLRLAESYPVVGNTIVYVEYNDEPLKMVKEIGLDSFKDTSIISAEKNFIKRRTFI